MDKYSYNSLLQIRSHLTNMIMLYGVTDERLSQLRVVEKLIAEKEKDGKDGKDAA